MKRNAAGVKTRERLCHVRPGYVSLFSANVYGHVIDHCVWYDASTAHLIVKVKEVLQAVGLLEALQQTMKD